jgi:hypothetical protein
MGVTPLQSGNRTQFWLAALGLAALFSAPLSAQAPPAAPSNLRVQSVGRTDVVLEWQDNSVDETQFRLEVRTLDSPFQDWIGSVDTIGFIEGLTPDTLYLFRVRARNGAGDSAYSNEVAASTSTNRQQSCATGGQELCVQSQRHKIRVYWQIAGGQQGRGNAVQLTADTGSFWFFHPDNVEMVVKVLDACTLNNAYWVFAGGLTNVQVIWTVTDTVSGAIRTYMNPLGTPFAPVQDTGFNVNDCGAPGPGGA